MRRREFLSALGGTAVTLPFAARAQQPTTRVGFLSPVSPSAWVPFIPRFLQGLKETGFIDGQNVVIEYRWAEGHYDRLPSLAADLVNSNVAVIFAPGGSDPAKAAKAATTKIPIVFFSAADPIKAGIITSINRPGANITGISLLGSSLETKRLGLLHEIAPAATSISALLNPKYPDVDLQLHDLQEASRAIKLPINIVRASTEPEIDTGIAAAAQQSTGALLVAQDPFFTSERERIATLTTRYRLPAVYPFREFAVAGGLMSYGTNFAEAFVQGGIYVGRILRGEWPGDLPVLQPTKFELVINLRTAKALGLAVPNSMQLLADEVIE